MTTRRDFLRHSTLLALAPTVPGFLARTARAAGPQRDGRALVVVELDGGNDGVNTVVPFKDEGYAKNRRRLRLPADRLLKATDEVGLHPAMGGAAKLLEGGRLAVVQGVGYPNPSRSHARSRATWLTARFDPEEHAGLGWLGRALDGGPEPPGGAPAAVHVGAAAPPVALRGRRSVTTSLAALEDFVLSPKAVRAPAGAAAGGDLAGFVNRRTLDAYASADRLAEIVRAPGGAARYPATDLAGRLRLVARLLKSGFAARVYYTSQGSYDTHVTQAQEHARLLAELSDALLAFLDDLAAARLADRVAVLCFSEFGRAVEENGGGGTDHGTAGPVFLAGPRVKPGLVGATPSLTDLDPVHGDLRVGVDFRRVYAGVLEDWLGLPAADALGGPPDKLPLFAG